MKEQIRLEKPGMKKFERKTVVQCFNAENHFLLTTLAKYYMDEGLKISNIEQFIQYIPSKGILPFANLITKMRMEAEKENLTTKGNTAKIMGNCGYGKVLYLTYIINEQLH